MVHLRAEAGKSSLWKRSDVSNQGGESSIHLVKEKVQPFYELSSLFPNNGVRFQCSILNISLWTSGTISDGEPRRRRKDTDASAQVDFGLAEL